MCNTVTGRTVAYEKALRRMMTPEHAAIIAEAGNGHEQHILAAVIRQQDSIEWGRSIEAMLRPQEDG